MAEDPTVRLQKVMAHAGVASRRQSEELIRQGRVTVNGQVVDRLGTKVDPDHDEIRVDGRRIQVPTRHIYVMLNKPRGVLSTMEDARGRKSIGDLVTVPTRLYPVGRLDVSSEGLVLLTDDGELTHRLTHPRYEHEKEYEVYVEGHPSEKTLSQWRRGVFLEGKRTSPAQVSVIKEERKHTWLRIVLHEGRKRQIRRVASMLGHPTHKLIRMRIGPVLLGKLKPGRWRHLTKQEISALRRLTKPKKERR